MKNILMALMVITLILHGCASKSKPLSSPEPTPSTLNSLLQSPLQIQAEIIELQAIQMQEGLKPRQKQRLQFLKTMLPQAGNKLENILKENQNNCKLTEETQNQMKPQNPESGK